MKKDLKNEIFDFGKIKDDRWYEFTVRENIDLNSRRTGRYNVAVHEFPSGAYPWSIIHLELGPEDEARRMASAYASDEMHRRKRLGLNLKNPHVKEEEK